MARRSRPTPVDEPEVEDRELSSVGDVVDDRELADEAEEVEEVAADREVGTIVVEQALPYEIRKDGSIAHFTQERASLQREVGS